MTTHDPMARTADGNFRILGAFWVAYGIFSVVFALWLISFSNTATVMFGALLNRVPNPFAMMTDFHLMYAVAIIWSIACGALGIIGGLGLLAGQRYGRTVALLAAFFSLCSVPLGTSLGICTLVILLPLTRTTGSTPSIETSVSNLRERSVTM